MIGRPELRAGVEGLHWGHVDGQHPRRAIADQNEVGLGGFAEAFEDLRRLDRPGEGRAVDFRDHVARHEPQRVELGRIAGWIEPEPQHLALLDVRDGLDDPAQP